jgi:hypothetical protein
MNKLTDEILENNGGDDELANTKAVVVDPDTGNVTRVMDWDPPCDFTLVALGTNEAAA